MAVDEGVRRIERRLTRPDGRVVAFTEWGDPDGLPYIDNHGTPGGRLGAWRDPTIYARFGLRRITFDRAGYGDSTRLPGRSIADIVPDVAAIADELGLDRFVVSGGSGGGPHSLAVAALLPERVLRCVAAVSPAPWDAEGFDHLAGMNPGNVEEFEAAMRGEAAHRPIAEREAGVVLERLRAGRADWLGDGYVMSESDRMEIGNDLDGALEELEDAIGRSVDGWVDDMLASVKPWGFDLRAIRCPVRLDYGQTDTFVPPANGDWLVANVPNAVGYVADQGHLGSPKLVSEILRWIAEGPTL